MLLVSSNGRQDVIVLISNFSIKNNPQIGAISRDPWARLGLEKFFEKPVLFASKICDMPSLVGGSFIIPPISSPEIALIGKTQDLIANETVISELLKYTDRIFFTERPVEVPSQLKDAGLRITSGDISFRQRYENKYSFRNKFPNLPFPKNKTYTSEELKVDDSFFRGLQELSNTLVLQVDDSAGGKGTYIVSNFDAYADAVNHIKTTNGPQAKIVISEYIEGQDISVQCCITKYGCAFSGIQRQIIDDPLLCSRQNGAEKFAGIETSFELDGNNQQKVYEICKILADDLEKEGYKGIFGVDFFYSHEKGLFLLELNARMTGASLLNTMLQMEAGLPPLSILHVLETCGLEYEMDVDLERYMNLPKAHTVTVFNIDDDPIVHPGNNKIGLHSGEYSFDVLGGLVRESDGVFLSGTDNFVLHSYIDVYSPVSTSGRICRVYKNGSFDSSDASTILLIDAIRDRARQTSLAK